MPRNDEGEYELLLGNRQLLSMFVIIVVLLGVFFALGFFTGKNTAPSTVLASKQSDAEIPKSSVPSPKISPATGDGNPTPGVTSSAESTPATQPVPESPSPAKPDHLTSSPADSAEPEPGQTFLQVTAVARPDADLIAKTLNAKNLATRLAPAPSGGLFRVLVGPSKDAADLARLRTALEQVGFRSPIVRKY